MRPHAGHLGPRRVRTDAGVTLVRGRRRRRHREDSVHDRSHPRRPRVSSPHYPWIVVGLLWFCGFFNYADRQASDAVFQLLKGEFEISDPQLGTLSSAFMLLYALTSPFTGYTVDLVSRRLLIATGLAFWSLVCAATALSRNFIQLLFFRAAEGLGESFYFPASMSMLADYHGPRTRSQAMGIHQTSVYLGTAGGWSLGGALGRLCRLAGAVLGPRPRGPGVRADARR